MDNLITVSPDGCGILIWLLWAVIGALAAVVASKIAGGRRVFLFDLVVGVVGGVLGGFLSTQCLGNTAMQLFLISVLAAAFAAGIVLWICGMLIIHFTNPGE